MEEKDPKKREEGVMDLVRKHFKPEFLNRIDETVIFSHLEKSSLVQIVEQYIKKLNIALQERGLTLSLSPAAIHLIIEQGYDRDYGARPLKRKFQKEIHDLLAMKILDGKYVSGDMIRVDLAGGKLKFS